MMKLLFWTAVLALVSPWSALGQNDAFEFRGDRIFVDRLSHWRNWLVPNTLIIDNSVGIDSTNLFDITAAGIKPKYFSNRKNYVLDREAFSYSDQVRFIDATLVDGQITALSNGRVAPNVGDGDPNTYWEPAVADYNQEGLRDWQIEVNLGRTIWADSIVVLMPPLEAGGEVAVPLVPQDIETLDELSTEMQAEVASFGRRTILGDLLAPRDLVSPAGDLVLQQGEVLLTSGQGLPQSIETIQLYNQLGIANIPVQGEKEAGDVPKSFAVEVSMGKFAGDNVSSTEYRFDVVGRAGAAGAQRRFVFPLEPLDRADFDQDGDPDIQGTFAHLIRLSIFDSDFDQKEFLGSGEEGQQVYEALAPERQGRQVFQRLTAGGFLKQVDEQTYNQLSEDERGPVRYFKRELPRVSEIQVWGPGTNLAYKPERRAGGGFEDGGRGSPWLATDGVYITKWTGNSWDLTYSTASGGVDQLVCCTMWLDLGAVFWIDNIYLGSLTHSENNSTGALFGLHMRGSDGTVLKPLSMRTFADMTQMEFGLSWTDLVSELHKDNNATRGRIMRESFERQRLRFFEFRNLDPTGDTSGNYSAPGHFSEIQMYGKGYPAEVSFISTPIVLLPGIDADRADQVKERRVLSQIFWEGEAIVHQVDPLTGQGVEIAEPLDLHPEVLLQVQTRTSETIDSLFAYYEVTGAGTASERRTEVDIVDFTELSILWDEYNAWEALPDERVLRLRSHQSNRDDDGDGAQDEDPIDGIDNDGDLLIDEDGLSGDNGGPNDRGTITLLKHVRRQDDDGDGAQDEDPIDGIDNDGDFLIDEDGKKKAKPRQDAQVEITPFFAGWSPWSEPYRPTAGESRAQITSPSPRKFLQIRVNIISEDPDVTARIKGLRVDLAPPISTDVVGELAILTDQGIERPVGDLTSLEEDYAPPRDISPLDNQPFSYFLRSAGPDPNAAGVGDGFDEVLLLTPSAAELTGVRLGTVQVVEMGAEESGVQDKQAVKTAFLRSFFASGQDNVLQDESGLSLQVKSTVDTLLIRFPESVNKDFGELDNVIVELQFKTQTLKAGTEFVAFVRTSASEGRVFQRVEAEGSDATELVNSQTARPTIIHTANVLAEVEVPQVFTPNNDGINDQLDIQFTVLRLRQDRPIKVGFYDLAGRLVAKAQPLSGSEVGQSGAFRYVWDGKNAADGLVAAGIYLCRIELKTDEEEIAITRLVSLVY